jgi:hypothetical protein
MIKQSLVHQNQNLVTGAARHSLERYLSLVTVLSYLRCRLDEMPVGDCAVCVGGRVCVNVTSALSAGLMRRPLPYCPVLKDPCHL